MKIVHTRIQMAVFLFLFLTLLGTTAFFLDAQGNQINTATTTDNSDIFDFKGGVSHGVYDFENKLYHSIDNPATMTDGTFSAIYSFEQYYTDMKNYILIIMVDFKQTEFEVDGKSYRNYPFSLEGKSECKIEFKLSNLSEDAYEMEYLVFPEPDCMKLSFSDEGWNNILSTGFADIDQLRFSSSKKPSGNLRYREGTQMSLEEWQYYDGVEISRYKSNTTLLPKAESGKKVYLTIGNYHEENEDEDYAAVAFCNWEQVDILPEEEILYIKLPSHTSYYYEINLPKVQKDSPYQIVTFYLPFGDEEDPYSYTSSRTIIKGER